MSGDRLSQADEEAAHVTRRAMFAWLGKGLLAVAGAGSLAALAPTADALAKKKQDLSNQSKNEKSKGEKQERNQRKRNERRR